MKKYFFIPILTILFSCTNVKTANSKESDKEITGLKDSINSLIVERQSSLNRINQLQKEKDSILSIFNKVSAIHLTENSDNIYINNSSYLNYAEIKNDNYWKRGVYYQGENNQENFYNVRVCTVNNQTRFYFIGIKIPVDPNNAIVNIYELNEDKTIYKIDSLDFFIRQNKEAEIIGENIHLQEFMLLQLDNLIINNGRLYYYKVLADKKEYYEYLLGSKKESKKVEHKIYSNHIIKAPDWIISVHPQKTLVAENLGETLAFREINNWSDTFNELYVNNNVDDYLHKELKEVNFDLYEHLPDINNEDLYTDPDTEENVLIGSISWHTRKRKLYFDNSGMTYRCIWEIDLNQNKLTKIVPEHEAIHPFFFEIKDRKYIAYVEDNKIMLCEPKE